MIDFNLKKHADYAFLTLNCEGTTIDLGLLDREEAKELLETFKEAVDDLEWFIHVTAKENDD